MVVLGLVLPKVGPVQLKTEYGGFIRTCRLRVPKDVSKPLPLVVLLHGFSWNGTDVDLKTGFGALAEREGFILACPDGLNGGWNAGFINLTGKKVDDIGYVGHIISDVESRYRIDPKAIFVAGQSNGAMLAHAIGTKLSKRLAAIACSAGTVGIHESGKGWRTVGNAAAALSVLIVHGDDDAVVGYNDKSNALIQGYSAAESASWWWKQFELKPIVIRESATNTRTQAWSSPDSKTEVRFVTIRKGTHDWQTGGNGKFSTTTAMWDFFNTHRRQ